MNTTAAANVETEFSPETFAKARQLCSLKRRRGEDRTVWLKYYKTRNHRQEIPINVNDSDTLEIMIFAGIPKLIVESGHVTINFRSSWGNVAEFLPGTSGKVTVPGDLKVSLYVADDAQVEIVTTRENRVWVARGYNVALPEGVTFTYTD